jgi:hypothetical protein
MPARLSFEAPPAIDVRLAREFEADRERQKHNQPRAMREAGCLYIKQQLEAFVGCCQPTIPANGSEGVLTVSRSRLLWTRV